MATTQEWIDELKAISVLELAERIKALEEEFGVSAAAVAAAAPAGGGVAAATARGRGGVLDRRRRPHRRRRQEDPGHQGRPRGDRPRSQGGQGARRRGPQARQGGHRARRGREAQGRARGGRRHRRAQVTPRAPGGVIGASRYARPGSLARHDDPSSASAEGPASCRPFAFPAPATPTGARSARGWPKCPLTGTIRRSADSRSRPTGRGPRHIRGLPGRGP